MMATARRGHHVMLLVCLLSLASLSGGKPGARSYDPLKSGRRHPQAYFQAANSCQSNLNNYMNSPVCSMNETALLAAVENELPKVVLGPTLPKFSAASCLQSPVCRKRLDDSNVRAIWKDAFSGVGRFIPGLATPCWKVDAKGIPTEPTMTTATLNTSSHISRSADINGAESIESTQYKCLPAFLLAGFAKSGTTELHAKLILHSSIQSSVVKEPTWLTRCQAKYNNSRARIDHKCSFSAYLIYFHGETSSNDTVSRNLTVFEGTPNTRTFWYRGNRNDGILTDVALPHPLSLLLPHLKIVVITRDPSSRLWSEFKFSTFTRYRQNSPVYRALNRAHANQTALTYTDSPEFFHSNVVSLIRDVLVCLSQYQR
jgi:hypothetical protein